MPRLRDFLTEVTAPPSGDSEQRQAGDIYSDRAGVVGTGFASASWSLMRARWRIAWNTFRRGARWRRFTYAIVLAALAFLSLVSLGASYGLTLAIIGITERPEAADVIIATVLSGTLVLSLMVGFTVSLAALYLSADLEMLLVAPISRRAVFVSKLVGGLLPGQLLILALAVVPLVGHGLARDYGAGYFLGMVVALAVLPVIPSAFGALVVVLVVRRVSAHRLGEVIGLLVVAMTLSIALVASNSRELQGAVTVADLLAILERFRHPYSPAEWLTLGLAAAGRGELPVILRWFGLSAAAAGASLIPLFLVSDRAYYDGWVRMKSSELRSRLRGGWLPWQRADRPEQLSRPSGLLRFLSPPTVAVLRKDMRLVPRDLTNMAQVLSPLAIGVFFVLQQVLYPVRIGGADRTQPFVLPMLAMLSAAIASGVAAMIMSRFGLTAFSFEGRRYWIVKSAPIRNAELLVGKFLVGYLPFVVLSWSLVPMLELARAVSEAARSGWLTPSGIASSVSWWAMGYGMFVTAVVGAGVLAISLAIGAARPNMRWDSPHEMMTPDIGCISIVLYGGYMAVTLITLALPAAFAGFPMLDRPVALWAAGLGTGLLVTAAVVFSSFRIADGELASVGE